MDISFQNGSFSGDIFFFFFWGGGILINIFHPVYFFGVIYLGSTFFSTSSQPGLMFFFSPGSNPLQTCGGLSRPKFERFDRNGGLFGYPLALLTTLLA